MWTEQASGSGTRRRRERSPEEEPHTAQDGWWQMTLRVLRTLLLFSIILGLSLPLWGYVFQGCGPSPCKTSVCQDLLDLYLASGNTSVAPCTDFFSFACGNINMTGSPFQALAEENKRRVRRILETPGSWRLAPGEEKAFEFYNSCMNMSAIEAAGASPFRQVIEEGLSAKPRDLRAGEDTFSSPGQSVPRGTQIAEPESGGTDRTPTHAGPPSLDDVRGEDSSFLRAHTGHLVHPGDFQTQHP